MLTLCRREAVSPCQVGNFPTVCPWLTQFFLKQSCEQKKLSLIPSFRQVGHCNELTSFSQPGLRHFRLEDSEAISAAVVGLVGLVGRKLFAVTWF
jgi:hypothetical protein